MRCVAINIYRSLLVVAMLITAPCVVAQNSGTTPLVEDATQYLFQRPEPWSGARYSEERGFWRRFYLSGDIGLAQRWQYDTELDEGSKWRWAGIGAGYLLSPVHSLEASYSWLDISGQRSLSGSYLFNLSSYAERTEDVQRFEIYLRGGVDYGFGRYRSLDFVGGLRLKYNLSSALGFYLEPGVSICCYTGDNDYARLGDFGSSVRVGMSMNIGETVNSTERVMALNRLYWDSYNLSQRKVLMMIKSNILFDIAMIPNIEVEFPISKRLSVEGQLMCGWWLKSDNSRCWQVQAADIEARYWFGARDKRRVMTGLFAGVFASGGFYDFQVKDTRGLQGEFYYLTGVSGGYSMALGRRLNLEFSAGVGYIVNNYQRYEVYEQKYLVADGPLMRYQSVLPAKVEVALGWVLFKRGERQQHRGDYRENIELRD